MEILLLLYVQFIRNHDTPTYVHYIEKVEIAIFKCELIMFFF